MVPRVAVLIESGAQVPVIPLVEAAGSAGAVEFRQRGPIGLKVGAVNGLTVKVIVAIAAHWLESGVKVYVPVARLLTESGLQVPVMPSREALGRTGATVPAQNAGMTVNVGVVPGFTVTVRMADVAHWPASGMKV